MKKLMMICVLVGATIIHASAIEGKGCENSSKELAENVNEEIDQPEVRLEKVSDQKYQLSYLETPEGKLTVLIRNNNNRVIFRDVIFAEKFFSKNYDLSNLELGNYQFEVLDSQSQQLMAEDILLKKESKKSTYDAKIERLDKESLAVFINNLDGVERTLKIFDQTELIYEEVIDDEKFEKKFKFENVTSLNNLSVQGTDGKGSVDYISSLLY
jgi:hypothetical protein